MPSNWVLPYPAQLPQDYFTKELPAPSPSPLVTPPTLPDYTPPSDPNAAVNNGGIWYGDEPPDSPQNGWLWANTQGNVFIYMDPGVWSQIGTNW